MVALALCACDLNKLLDVDHSDVITPGDIQGARGAELFAAGALGQFALAFGSSAGQVLASGLMADEFLYSGVFPQWQDIDGRAVEPRNSSVPGIYRALHNARVGLENAADVVAEFLPGDPRLSEMHGLAGYAYVFFGESFCPGVPFGRTLPGGEATQGQQRSTEETFTLALERFAAASAAAAGSAGFEHLAAVGAARALLNLGRYDEAASRASGVPTTWEHLIRYKDGADPSQENQVFTRTRLSRDWSLSDREGGNGLPFRSEPDARVTWLFDGGTGADNQTPHYQLTKYDSAEDDIVLASGIEARLIETEAALHAGDVDLMLTKLNDLRATLELGDLSDPGTLDGRVDLLFSERARWMFATAHRLGDMRRLVRQYGRSADTVFPVGFYREVRQYGTDTDLIVPDDENANPNFSGCFNR